ncbi:type II glyceraldehyde-3-phosphate dehydrogenase [Candidatus Undinarchaeota archaeon]
MTVKVAVNGGGTIGKRICDAVSLQDDMKIVGVTKSRANYQSKMLVEQGYPLYLNDLTDSDKFDSEGIKYEGSVEDLLSIADIVVDCAPGKVGAENKEKLYIPNDIKAIYQGGEKAHTAEVSFNAQSNYLDAIGKSHVRVVSCNTTGSCRLLNALNNEYKLKKVYGVYIRRGADPGQIKKGPINAIVPNPPSVPSHHGPDVQTVLDIDIDTMAVLVPTTLMHLHEFIIQTEKKAKTEDVLKLLSDTPRIRIVSAEAGINSTAELIELARDLKRPRNDLWENCIWKESITAKGDTIFVTQAIAQESIVVPENIDCIRAMTGLEKDPLKSIQKTDKSLGL